MESFTPPFAPSERAPEAHDPPQKTKMRNFFELFKKAEEPPKPQRAELDPSPEHHPVAVQRRKRLAETVFTFLRRESTGVNQTGRLPLPSLHEQSQPLPQGEVELRTAPPHAASQELLQPEMAAEKLPFVERAKEMGRNVIKLIRRTRDEVQAADKQEAVPIPTDLRPLAEADADVRSAVQELIAPIEAYQKGSEQVVPAAESTSYEAPVPMRPESPSGVDGLSATPEAPLASSPFVRAIEAVASVAALAGREALTVKERLEKRALKLQKIGVIAIGATTVGGVAYTWHRMRRLKKERRAMQREHQKFEAEVRHTQAKEERRLRRLENTQPNKLTQPKRQQYVEQVSEFAHQQASEIRTVARSRELLQSVAVAAVVERPKRRAEAPSRDQVEVQQPMYNTARQERQPFIDDTTQPNAARIERSERPDPVERKVASLESSPERLKSSTSIQQQKSQTTTVLAAAAAQLKHMVTGRTTPSAPITSVAPKKMNPVQEWPFMLAIVAGAIVFVLLVLGIL